MNFKHHARNTMLLSYYQSVSGKFLKFFTAVALLWVPARGGKSPEKSQIFFLRQEQNRCLSLKIYDYLFLSSPDFSSTTKYNTPILCPSLLISQLHSIGVV